MKTFQHSFQHGFQHDYHKHFQHFQLFNTGFNMYGYITFSTLIKCYEFNLLCISKNFNI